MTLIVILGICLAIAFLYNKIIRLGFLVDEAWSGIDVQLKKRFDLIPSLVLTVKGYTQHEASLLEDVSKVRQDISNSKNTAQRTEAERNVSTQLKQLIALSEAYPDLKANTNFLSLSKSLIAVEDDLQYARRYYNGTVRDFNVAVESFPGNLISRLFRFSSRPFFEIEYATERMNPDVSFN